MANKPSKHPVSASLVTRKKFRRFGLPHDFILHIAYNTLEAEIERCRQRYLTSCAAMDAWEQENAELYAELPWHDSRETWKAAGRPEPEWYELLEAFSEATGQPICGQDLMYCLAPHNYGPHRRHRLAGLAKKRVEKAVRLEAERLVKLLRP